MAFTGDSPKKKNERVEELILSLSKGRATSMSALYDLIKTDIFAYALSKTSNKADAEDIMQDTFVRIYQYAPQYTPKGKPLAWIFTIERNLIYRHFQKNSRVLRMGEEFGELSDETDYEQGVVNGAFLAELLRMLDYEEREIVTLHAVSGLKHREIAALMGKPLSTVLSKYNRAIKKMRFIEKEGKNE